MGERDALARSRDLGVITTRGVRGRRSLGAKQVEVLRGRRGDRQPEVAARAQREEPLDAGRGVLGPLALVAVGQEQDESGVLAPLVLGGHQEVVDDDLRTVDEVAELGLPGHQGPGGLDRVAVLEAHRRVLRQERVADREAPGRARLAAHGLHVLPQVGEGHALVAGGVVDEHGVALAERAPAGVLAGQAHVDPREEQRPKARASPNAQSTSPESTSA